MSSKIANDKHSLLVCDRHDDIFMTDRTLSVSQPTRSTFKQQKCSLMQKSGFIGPMLKPSISNTKYSYVHFVNSETFALNFV